MKRLRNIYWVLIFIMVMVIAIPSSSLAGNNKVTICHYPPGNPENPQTITISEKALAKHLLHGDSIGSCEDNCTTGFVDCDEFPGCETDLNSDRDNCGLCALACGQSEICVNGYCYLACPPGLQECGGECVNLQIDRRNCGECDTPCNGGEICNLGGCVGVCE